jgi:hypothetical protein
MKSNYVKESSSKIKEIYPDIKEGDFLKPALNI